MPGEAALCLPVRPRRKNSAVEEHPADPAHVPVGNVNDVGRATGEIGAGLHLERVVANGAKTVVIDEEPEQQEEEAAHVRVPVGDRWQVDYLAVHPLRVRIGLGVREELLVCLRGLGRQPLGRRRRGDRWQGLG